VSDNFDVALLQMIKTEMQFTRQIAAVKFRVRQSLYAFGYIVISL